jgi:hypothetical protein
MRSSCAIYRDQIATVAVTTAEIMNSAAFAAGVHDVRSGARPRFDAFGDDWAYERGRLFACIAPVSMKLIEKGRPNPQAVALLNAARRRGLVI